jgi:hypothetical protein
MENDYESIKTYRHKHWPDKYGLVISVDTAEARIGRPATPMSVAGVHRRAHRRAYYYHNQVYHNRVYYHGHYYYR